MEHLFGGPTPFFLFLLLGITLLFLRQRAVPGKAALYTRALFPSWRFFEDLVEIPRLSYRIEGEEEWTSLAVKIERRPQQLLYNPRGNLLLAIISLFQQQESEIGEMTEEQIESLEKSVSFELVRNVVRNQIGSENCRYQFRLTRMTVHGEEHFLVTRVLEG